MSEMTRLLNAINHGDRQAANQLLPLIYDELRRLAALRMRNERPGQTLDATALVHEAYLRLVGPGDAPRWEGRGHFFAAAAEAMRRILIENARRKERKKHGGGLRRITLAGADLPEAKTADELLAIDEALTRFTTEEPVAAQLVKLRYFVGLSIGESADVLGVSRATAYRYWAYAKAWFRCEFDRPENSSDDENVGEIS
jgi:RNA polymerase sigma factor (TIGR02999 family)